MIFPLDITIKRLIQYSYSRFIGDGPGGKPLLANGQPNPFANCEPLGLVSIIQEEDMSCPDDTSKGGYITFTFRHPVELALTSLLDIDEGGNSPKVFIYQGSQKDTFDTEPTGNNGLFPLHVDTSVFTDVTMIDVKYWGSGSINSLKYRYCPETPTPKISITKFAGPAGSCNAEGVSSSTLEDHLYTVPSNSDNWAYCYEVSVPESSEECLYDVSMNDPAPIGGLQGHSVTQPSDRLCPGETVYISGSSFPGSAAPEGMIDATVTGTGYYSGQTVTHQDAAAVELYEVAATQAPTPEPVPPAIEIVKYAGPPGRCSAAGLMGDSLLEDDLYTVPSSNDEWVYCYKISVPSTSGECLVDMELNDPAPVGGLQNQDINLPAEGLCPGDDDIYVEGPSIAGSMAPEGPINAKVTAKGIQSGDEVTDEDPAAVKIYDDIIIIPKCEMDDDETMVNPGSDYCPHKSGVSVLHVTGADSTPEMVDMLWDIEGSSSGSTSSSVSFKVRNPFPVSTQMFIKYDQPAGESGGAWTQECDQHELEPCGGTISTSVTAKCLEGNGNPFTLVNVFFADTTVSLADQIFGPVDIDECCHPGDDVSSNNVAQYSFLIRCSCPPDDDVVENIPTAPPTLRPLPVGGISRGGSSGGDGDIIRVSSRVDIGGFRRLRGVDSSSSSP